MAQAGFSLPSVLDNRGEIIPELLCNVATSPVNIRDCVVVVLGFLRHFSALLQRGTEWQHRNLKVDPETLFQTTMATAAGRFADWW